mmetsp:Transcript_45295/g.101970  ORF Transcript_45295/g.101970 Transcript_45295/m.101970 type:complete len:237 (-) Transcript_45295:23-733(-)
MDREGRGVRSPQCVQTLAAKLQRAVEGSCEAGSVLLRDPELTGHEPVVRGRDAIQQLGGHGGHGQLPAKEAGRDPDGLQKGPGLLQESAHGAEDLLLAGSRRIHGLLVVHVLQGDAHGRETAARCSPHDAQVLRLQSHGPLVAGPPDLAQRVRRQLVPQRPDLIRARPELRPDAAQQLLLAGRGAASDGAGHVPADALDTRVAHDPHGAQHGVPQLSAELEHVQLARELWRGLVKP